MRLGRTLSVQGSHAWRGDSAVFDEENLVSHAGLVPLMELAEQTGLSRLLDEHVRFTSERVKSGAANATPKLTSIIAGMAAGADSIDDLDVIRAGGMKKLFGGVYAAATLGILLREFTHGHARQLSAVLRRLLVALPTRTAGAGRHRRTRVHRHRFAAAPGVRARQAGRVVRAHEDRGQEVLRRGLSPLAATISTEHRGAGAGRGPAAGRKAGSAKGAASMVTEAINTATEPPARTRRTSWYAATPRTAPARSSPRSSRPGRSSPSRSPATPPSTPRSPAIPDEAYTPVHYPGAVTTRTPAN